MITNLLCYIFITLATNTSTVWPMKCEQTNPNTFTTMNSWVADTNAPQKDVVTTVTETTHIVTFANGMNFETARDKVLLNVTNHFELVSEWKPSTNQPPPPGQLFVTNYTNVMRLKNYPYTSMRPTSWVLFNGQIVDIETGRVINDHPKL